MSLFDEALSSEADGKRLSMSKLKILLPIFILLLSCNTERRNVFTELNDTPDVAPTSGVKDFETQWFQYSDSTGYNLNDLCVVKYYVNGDTIFSSEKYSFASIGYSWDEDTTLAYHNIIFFDQNQKRNKDGWYSIVIEENYIPREPETHLSSIALRSYRGNRYDYKNETHADALLFNVSKEIEAGRDRNVLSPQLKKLYETIK